MLSIAALVHFFQRLSPESGDDHVPYRASEALDTPHPKDEFVTIAIYDKATDAHIALGRLAAEGIQAQIFDENTVQMGLNTLTTFGGIKLRVTRNHEKAARQVLETDYSKTLENADLGKRED